MRLLYVLARVGESVYILEEIEVRQPFDGDELKEAEKLKKLRDIEDRLRLGNCLHHGVTTAVSKHKNFEEIRGVNGSSDT